MGSILFIDATDATGTAITGGMDNWLAAKQEFVPRRH